MDAKKCQCGTPKTEHKGVLVCTGHCDQPCAVPVNKTCPVCLNYGAAVSLRVLTELKEERRGPRRTDD